MQITQNNRRTHGYTMNAGQLCMKYNIPLHKMYSLKAEGLPHIAIRSGNRKYNYFRPEEVEQWLGEHRELLDYRSNGKVHHPTPNGKLLIEASEVNGQLVGADPEGNLYHCKKITLS